MEIGRMGNVIQSFSNSFVQQRRNRCLRPVLDVTSLPLCACGVYETYGARSVVKISGEHWQNFDSEKGALCTHTFEKCRVWFTYACPLDASFEYGRMNLSVSNYSELFKTGHGTSPDRNAPLAPYVSNTYPLFIDERVGSSCR